MKRTPLALTAVILLVVLGAAVHAASTVRGKLLREVEGRGYPVAGIMLHLIRPKGAPLTTYSGSEGLFYFYNVTPGEYTLEVVVSSTDVRKFGIHVEGQPYTDIAPITIR